MVQPDPLPALRASRWRVPLEASGVFVALAAIFLANGREIGQYDTEATTLTAMNLARGGGIFLDRFAGVLVEGDGRRAPYVADVRGHVLSRYPLVPAFAAAPIVWPQALWFDRIRPGWDRDPLSAWAHAKWMGKNAAALLTALCGAALFATMRSLGLGPAALGATIAGMLGSDLWVVASQALWQHGPAALFLTAAVGLLSRPDPRRRRYLLSGACAALMVGCRLNSVILAVALAAWVARFAPRRLPIFLAFPILGAAGLTWFNLHFFGEPSGGLAALEAMHPELHGTPAGAFSGSIPTGAAGSLFSPSRGLFVFCPWAALAIAAAPWSLRERKAPTLVVWMALTLIPWALVLFKYPVWWAGHTFGPRYWADAMPLLAILAGYALAWSRGRRRFFRLLMTLAILWAVAIQAIGATCFPSSWNLRPTNIDRDHARLWHWADTEVSRALIEALDRRSR